MAQIFETNDTIAAPATSNTPQAISVIRVAGPRALEICRKFLKNKNHPVKLKHKKVSLADITSNGKLLDKSISVYFRKPDSYSGEDTVEIYCHGSPYIVSKVMELAINCGARPARAGEFTMRAYLNGKLDLAQAEGVCALINSQTQSSHKAALNLTEGKISQKLNRVKTDLIEMLACIEARLDDSSEELQTLSANRLKNMLSPIIREIKKLAETFTVGKLITSGIKTAIVGPPNCGKSSLLNRLSDSDRAIVSKTPGTTRDTIEEALNLGGNRFVLIDTAGIRKHSLDTTEKEGMKRTYKAIDKADIILFVTDVNSPVTQADIALWRQISKSTDGSKRLIKVINKCDLLKNEKIKLRGSPNSVRISCKTGKGVEDLKKKMIETANLSSTAANELIITSTRHYDGLNKAYSELCFINGLKNTPLELVAEHIRSGLRELTDILGETTPDDILDVIFKNFCFGK
jgi:tRNA modification GTPase